ncbi:hypothetical protein GCM10010168_46570 [Actinoplanes ianthinogenes]|uniref:TetR family transcriptional regulator n=1 Tax=Actinoplanes ianthinogenes TaxID=122358 RepID=A0ABM7LPB2_9ACTN|nr:hypothetical protein [Actinoplanes ianthinogenes]BCJ41044.1 hypothetical protein Aiant_17010 [Actinoplanes ianthinogenes]GGR23283.1 hypothetical protein GCM10010168_46570 [Actinoplanes ianthinogenes]
MGETSVRIRPARPPGGTLYASKAAGPRDAATGVRMLSDLAADGLLAAAAAPGSPRRAALTRAAYDLVWPIVFTRLTRRVELRRGHPACASGVERLADGCLDRFHDDVEAVVDDLLTHAHRPILRLEAWVAARVGAATVNAHRRRRGERGALQRPRLPGWLAAELGGDRWLCALAIDILVWVGVRGTAGTGTWPLESWAQDRARHTGDWVASDPGTVAREVDRVLAAMRRRPSWYESFVERPLGAKQPPVAVASVDAWGEPVAPFPVSAPDQQVESELQRLAAEAVRTLRARLATGEPAEPAVVEVIRTVFGGMLTSTLDQPPHLTCDPVGGITGALTEPARRDRIVAAALTIVAGPD